MGFGHRGCSVCFGVPPAAAGLGRVVASTGLPSIVASSGESVEVELHVHSIIEDDVNGLKWGSAGIPLPRLPLLVP